MFKEALLSQSSSISLAPHRIPMLSSNTYTHNACCILCMFIVVVSLHRSSLINVMPAADWLLIQLTEIPE